MLWLERKALVLAALPAAVYFALTALFGVNVIVWDEWSVIPYLVRFQTGTLTVGDLWLDGNMHRRLFPNLISLFFATQTHLDTKLEMFFSDFLVVVAFVGVYVAVSQAVRRTWTFPFFAGCILFSLAQHENATWGFNIAWDLVLACACVSIAVLRNAALGRSRVAFAMLAATVGAYSSFQGLLIWPAVLIASIVARESRRFLFVWTGAAVVVYAVYFFHIHLEWATPTHTPLLDSVRNPLGMIAFALAMLGTVGGTFATMPNDVPTLSNPLWAAFVLLVGLVFLAFVVSAFARVREISLQDRSTAIYLMTFGLLFVATTTVGRVGAGFDGAATSRYVTYTLLALVGVLIVFTSDSTRHRMRLRAFLMFVALISCTAAFSGIVSGVSIASQRTQALALLPEYETTDAASLRKFVGWDPRALQSFVPIAWKQRLGSFYTDAGREYSGPVPDEAPLEAAFVHDAREVFHIAPTACWQQTLRVFRSVPTFASVYRPEIPDSAVLFIESDDYPSWLANCRTRFLTTAKQSEESRNLVTGPDGDLYLEAGWVWDSVPPRDLHIFGWGGALGPYYGSLNAIPVKPDERYRIAATVDARGVSATQPCFYLAAFPSGTFGMTCVPDGKKTEASSVVTIPKGVAFVRFIALTAGAVVARNAPLTYIDPSVVRVENY